MSDQYCNANFNQDVQGHGNALTCENCAPSSEPGQASESCETSEPSDSSDDLYIIIGRFCMSVTHPAEGCHGPSSNDIDTVALV